MHIRVHEWVGGNMSSAFTSPNDPVFWLHHCYMDKLWADWQGMHQDQYAYLPDYGASTGHNLKDPMAPWNARAPIDVLNTWDLGYHYDNDASLMANDVLYPSQGIASPRRRYGLTYGKNLVFQSSDTGWVSWVSTASPLPDLVGVRSSAHDDPLVLPEEPNRDHTRVSVRAVVGHPRRIAECSNSCESGSCITSVTCSGRMLISFRQASFYLTCFRRRPLRTAGGRWAGRPGSLPPSGWTASRPGRARCPGRHRGTAAFPVRRPRGR